MGTNISACCSIEGIDKNNELNDDNLLDPREHRRKESVEKILFPSIQERIFKLDDLNTSNSFD